MFVDMKRRKYTAKHRGNYKQLIESVYFWFEGVVIRNCTCLFIELKLSSLIQFIY